MAVMLGFNHCALAGTVVRAGLCLVLLLGFSRMVAADPAAAARLAVFDIGSGSTRMLVVELETCSEAAPVVIHRSSVRLSFAGDLLASGGNRFSEQIRSEADAVMSELVARARALGAERLVGVATQAFRTAIDGQTLLDSWQQRYGLVARVISPEEEARLGYRLVADRFGAVPEGLLVWDIGAGSQQLVWHDRNTRNWQHVNSDLASVTFRDHALAVLERPAGAISPNPISSDEAERLVATLVEWLDAEQVAQVAAVVSAGFRVVGIGGVHGASLVNQLGLARGDPVDRMALSEALGRQLERSDEDIGGEYADTDVTNLILVGALMDQFGIDRYQVTGMDLTDALVLAMAADCRILPHPLSPSKSAMMMHVPVAGALPISWFRQDDLLNPW